MEAQISDDIEIALRIFNYSVHVALERKEVSDDGSYMRINMPLPVVIYWEGSKAKDTVSVEIVFPGNKSVVYEIPAFKVLQHSVAELEHMALLLPFYILKIRKELERTKDSEKRKALSKKLEDYVVEISRVLKKCVRNNYITDRDAAMLLRRLLGMNLELYGGYREFKEVNMNKRLEKLVDPDFCERWDRAIAEKAAKVAAKVTAEVTAKVTAKVERRSLKQGISQGITQGLTQTAKNMLARGYSIADIIGITNLSREQIKALR
jgi:hypothetical protein